MHTTFHIDVNNYFNINAALCSISGGNHEEVAGTFASGAAASVYLFNVLENGSAVAGASSLMMFTSTSPQSSQRLGIAQLHQRDGSAELTLQIQISAK